MKAIPFLIAAAAVVLAVGVVLRCMGQYAALDLTPSAFLRFSDSILLFAIAVGFYGMLRRNS